MALSYYLKETGDFGVSHVEVPFLNPDDPYAAPLGGATVRDHALLAQRHLLEHRGRHGLSKIFYGDWCDTMNGVGRRGEGVSVMLTMQVKWRCDLTAELARHLGNNSVAAEMAAASAELDRAVEESAWDDAGGYCVRAFDNDGVVVGSSQGPVSDGGELRIFLNPQSWSVTSGISSGARREVCLRAVRDQLETGYGKVLSFPQSTFFKPRIGQMSVMPPGFYENGSAYTHGNCFWAAALAMAGLGDEAWDAIRTILPDTPNKPNTDTKPFTIPNMYIGPVVERRMQRSLYLSGWRTGSAAWLYLAAIEGILGARAEYNGLRIDPHLPSDWPEASLARHSRGAAYEIHIRRDPAAAPGSIRLTVDGTPVEGSLVFPKPAGSTSAGSTCRIEAVIG